MEITIRKREGGLRPTIGTPRYYVELIQFFNYQKFLVPSDELLCGFRIPIFVKGGEHPVIEGLFFINCKDIGEIRGDERIDQPWCTDCDRIMNPIRIHNRKCLCVKRDNRCLSTFTREFARAHNILISDRSDWIEESVGDIIDPNFNLM